MQLANILNNPWEVVEEGQGKQDIKWTCRIDKGRICKFLKHNLMNITFTSVYLYVGWVQSNPVKVK